MYFYFIYKYQVIHTEVEQFLAYPIFFNEKKIKIGNETICNKFCIENVLNSLMIYILQKKMITYDVLKAIHNANIHFVQYSGMVI